MCGIWGLISTSSAASSAKEMQSSIRKLFLLSQARGKEAAGLALLGVEQVLIYKDSVSASRMLRSRGYKNFLQKHLKANNKLVNAPYFAAMGHTRLATHGLQMISANNQPVVKNGIVIIHNGIITNADELWRKYQNLRRETEVDTEIIAALINMYVDQGASIPSAIQKTFSEIRGEASIALFFSDRNSLVLATNTGSLYTLQNQKNNVVAFVSEAYVAQRLAHGKHALKGMNGNSKITQIRAGSMQIIDLTSLQFEIFSLKSSDFKTINVAPKLAQQRSIEEKYLSQQALRNNMQRCSRCILPVTMPYIEFDAQGVCNYCNNYSPNKTLSRDSLEARIAQYRKGNGKPDCLVAFSGGRDSSYGLHLLKNELGMNPIAYTYDWGMITDLGRRNQARMCGQLGVEHLWVSADINAKRANIRRNVKAWLKRPNLGVVPLFMAGDKQFFYHANRTMKQTGLELMVFCMNNYERTDFKAGFSGVPPKVYDGRTYTLHPLQRIKILFNYGKQFILNPGYINRSILNTLTAYASYYFIKQDYLYLFDYFDWDEKTVTETLTKTYGWELGSRKSGWRNGDATTPFYNYLYYNIAGFTENDTFKSNQIREEKISRDEALSVVAQENQPNWCEIREYLSKINIDFMDVVRVVDSVPKLYVQSK